MNDIGININEEREKINIIFRATQTRFKRCLLVKKAAIVKIGRYEQKNREYGFKHLLRIIAIQTKSYPRYVKNLRVILKETEPLKEKIISLEPLEANFLGKISFTHRKKKLLELIVNVEENFVSIEQKTNFLINHINHQEQLFKSQGFNLSGDQEAWLKRSILLEEKESEAIMKDLSNCVETSFILLKKMDLFQIRFLNFLKRSLKNKFSNLIDESQIVCDKIKDYISTFYAFKSYTQAIGFAVGMFAPDGIIKASGWAIAGGVFGIDYLMDWVAGLPETQKIIARLKAKIKGTVDEEEEKWRNLRDEFYSLAKSNMDITDI